MGRHGGWGSPATDQGSGRVVGPRGRGSPLTASRGVGHHIVGTVVGVGGGAALTDGALRGWLLGRGVVDFGPLSSFVSHDPKT